MFTSKTALVAAAAFALFATPLVAQTAKEKTQSSATSPQEFVTKAANGGMFEVESSRLALDKAKRGEVRTFAQRMVDDHSKANAELETIASKAGLNVPKAMDATHKQKLQQLETGAESNFDQRYIRAQAEAHDEAVTLFSTYAKSGGNPELRSFADKTLPTLREHQASVRDLEKSSSGAVGSSTGGSGKSTGSGSSK